MNREEPKVLITEEGKLGPPLCGGGEHGRIGLGAEQWLHAVLHQIGVAAREPARRLPQQPAVDVGARLQVGRIVRRLAALVGREERGAEVTVGEQHRDRAGENREREQEQESRYE